MLADIFCHKFLTKSLSWMHTKRRNSLISHVKSLLGGKGRLEVTKLGRYLPGKAKVKHKINMCRRFVSNKKLHKQVHSVYHSLCRAVIGALPELFIAVDWTGCCSPESHMLRASLVYDGRSIPLYNEIHPQKDLGTEQVHNQFLDNLKKALPEGKRIIIITDGGFKTPWFYKVSELGWNFIGRANGTINYRLNTDKNWNPLKTLFTTVRRGVTCYLGIGRLGQDSKTQMEVLFIAHWGHKKGRKNPKPQYPDVEKRHSKQYNEPMILVTNLHQDSSLDVENKKLATAILVRNIYKKRMQIEQNFRDDKSERFGFSWRFSRTKDENSMSILILIATITSIILWMIGFAAEQMKLQYHFQANTVRSHRVLSFLTLAKQIIDQGFHDFNIRKFERIITSFHFHYNENSPLSLFYKGESKK